MYCKYCGKEIDDRAAVCIHCGVPTDNYQYSQAQQQPQQAGQPVNVLAIVGFALSFFIAIAGLVCSIIAYRQAPQYNGNGKNFALAGIVISAIELAISVLAFILVIVILIFFDAAVVVS